MFTRQQLKETGELYSPPYSVLGQAYQSLARGKTNFVSFHSDVYYCRAAIEKHLGVVLSLGRTEAAMKAEGWSEGKGRKK